VSRPSAPTPGLGTLLQPFASCTGVTLGELAGVVLAFVLVLGLHAASAAATRSAPTPSARRGRLPRVVIRQEGRMG
jgi:hypothetical protein